MDNVRHRPVLFDQYSRRSQQRIERDLKILSSSRAQEELETRVSQSDHRECVFNVSQAQLIHEDVGNDSSEDSMSIDELSMIMSEIAEEHLSDHDGETGDDNSMETGESEEEGEISTSEDEDVSQEDEFEDSGEGEHDDRIDDRLLYDGAGITVGESALSILSVLLRHSLTGNCLADILKLIEIHCRRPNHCVKSLYLFRKYFKNIYTPLRRHFFCSNCYGALREEKDSCQQCPKGTEVCYFIHISIESQLETLYKRFNFFHQLQTRFNRRKIDPNNYEDIYDGKIYQELNQLNGILSDPNNISLTWNTDGISLFKSSNFQIWPFFLSINELPYIQRTKKENLILAGLWFGSKKPFPPLYLKPIVHELEKLKSGIELQVPSLNSSIHVEVTVICGTCDLPAKALFLNMKQYNGEYGCQKCKIRSEAYERSTIRVYPFERHLDRRTQEETDNFAAEAVHYGGAPYGVKGPSVIAKFVPNYIRCTAVDEMHAVFLGIVKLLLILWFSSNFSSRKWSLSKYSKIVDQYIRAIRPPNFVPRLPRSISEHLRYFKASELKLWFFYYSVPILKLIMPNVYFEHFLLLVDGMFLLNQSSFSDEMIDKAEALFIEFVARFSDLYDRRFMTANLHLLPHLPETARDFGPLWVTSCFAFENANGQLKTLINGTRFSGLQICTGLSYYMALPELIQNLRQESIVGSFCERLTNPQRKYKSQHLHTDLYGVGKMKKEDKIPDFIWETLESSNTIDANMGIFYRLMKSGILYTSQMYRRGLKTNSTHVKFMLNDHVQFGIIVCFIKASDCQCKSYCVDECHAKYMAVIKKLITVPEFNSNLLEYNVSRYYQYNVTDDTIVVDVMNFLCVCFSLQVPGGKTYIVEPVNCIEVE